MTLISLTLISMALIPENLQIIEMPSGGFEVKKEMGSNFSLGTSKYIVAHPGTIARSRWRNSINGRDRSRL
jgi:hypothetical protein